MQDLVDERIRKFWATVLASWLALRGPHRGSEGVMSDQLNEAVEAAWAYEGLHVDALFRQWAQPVLDAAGVTGGSRVLDVACGTGVVAREALGRVGPTGSVIGLDIGPGMVAVAETIEPAVTWTVGDAGKLPFDDDEFDAVVSQFGLMFFTDRVQAIREMLRCAKPGTRVSRGGVGFARPFRGVSDLGRPVESPCRSGRRRRAPGAVRARRRRPTAESVRGGRGVDGIDRHPARHRPVPQRAHHGRGRPAGLVARYGGGPRRRPDRTDPGRGRRGVEPVRDRRRQDGVRRSGPHRHGSV